MIHKLFLFSEWFVIEFSKHITLHHHNPKGSKQQAQKLLEGRFEQMGLTYQHFPGIHYVASKLQHKTTQNYILHNKNNSNINNDCIIWGDDKSRDGKDSNYGELLLEVKQLLNNKPSKYPYDLYNLIKVLTSFFVFIIIDRRQWKLGVY